jgi:hypothetical protein
MFGRKKPPVNVPKPPVNVPKPLGQKTLPSGMTFGLGRAGQTNPKPGTPLKGDQLSGQQKLAAAAGAASKPPSADMINKVNALNAAQKAGLGTQNKLNPLPDKIQPMTENQIGRMLADRVAGNEQVQRIGSGLGAQLASRLGGMGRMSMGKPVGVANPNFKPGMKKGGAVKASSASKRGDGCAIKGKTKGRMV